MNIHTDTFVPDVNVQQNYELKKAQEILSHLEQKYDVTWLRHKALSRYGLVSDDIRKRVWPILSGVNENSYKNNHKIQVLENHPMSSQVELDVRRMKSLISDTLSADESEQLIIETKRLALSILHDHSDLNYYQGFHDICFVFLDILGPDEAYAVLNQIVTKRFSIFMQKTMDSTSEMLRLVFDLLEVTAPEIFFRLQALNLEPFFALSWFLTWFTHVLSSYKDIHRLYDLFLASDPHMLIYLSVGVIICSTVELKSTADDFGELHHALTHLPMKHDVEKLIACAFLIYQNVPPEQLLRLAEKRRHGISPSSASILNTNVASHWLHRIYAIRNEAPWDKMAVCGVIVIGLSVIWQRFF